MPTDRPRQLHVKTGTIRGDHTRTRCCPQGDRLDHVCRSPYPAIHEQLEFLVRETQPPPSLQLSRYLNEDFDPRPSEVELPTPMVREHNSGQPSIIGLQGVLTGESVSKCSEPIVRCPHLPTLHTLQDQRHWIITLSLRSWIGGKNPLLVMFLNQSKSFHDSPGSMKD